MADRSEQEQGQPEMWEIRRFHAGYRRGARDRRAGVDTSGHRDEPGETLWAAVTLEAEAGLG
jgi:hypothetical protein